MTPDDLLTALKQRKLELDCFEMTVVQNSSAKPICYKGRGYIRQGENDTLSFKLYASETKNTDAFANLKQAFGAASGRLFADDEYYTLAARTSDGAQWTTDRVLIDCDWTSFASNPIVTGGIFFLSAEKATPSGTHSIRVYFFDDVELPYTLMSKTEIDGRASFTRSLAKFMVGNIEFSVRREAFGFLVEAKSATVLDEHLDTRIQESMRYITGKNVAARVILRNGLNERTEIRSAPARAAKTHLDPPLLPNHIGSFEDGWRLFSSYIKYVMETSPHPYMHRSSYYLYNACEASAGSFDLWAVGVSVAVEGLANLIPRQITREEKRTLVKLRKSVVDHILSYPCFQSFAERVKGLFGMMFNVSVRDRLKPLVESGNVAAEHVDAWSELRNKHVHPKDIDLRKLTSGDYQEMLDLIHKVTVLMYHITFFLNGYTGKFTDYAASNWPTRDYPWPPRVEPPASA